MIDPPSMNRISSSRLCLRQSVPNSIKQEARLSQRGRAMLRVCIASVQNVERSLLSHTRTVVRECCKGDNASQWRNPKFDPPPHHAQTP